MAELQVGIKADVSGARRFVRSLKEIKKAAGLTTTSMAKTTAAATNTSVAMQTTVSASGQLATTQNLAAAANVAVARTLGGVATKATQTAVAEKAATTQTNLLTASLERMSLAGTKAFFKVGAGAKRFTTQARTAAGSLAGMSIAAQGFGALVAVGLGIGVKSAIEFELTMSRIEGLVGIAASEVAAFNKPLLAIAKATAKGPNELAEALFFITSAGFEGAEAMSVLEASARAAAAGLGETKNVADAVTSAVNAYGIENLSAAKATDILVATVREGKAEAESIAGALGQILPVAAELGIEFEELGGTIAALTRIGLGADQASTALGATMSALQKITPDAEKALNEFGLTGSGLRKTIREEGLLVGLQQMNEAFGDNETALIRVIPNIRALRAVLPLVGKNAGNVAKIFEDVADSAGAADAAFEVYTKTTSFELSQSLVVLQTTLMKLGNDILPAVTLAFVKFVEIITDSIAFIDKFSQNVAEFFVGTDDPLKQAQQNLKEVETSLRNLDVSRIGQGAAEFNAMTNSALGVTAANIDLEGSLEEQVALLETAKQAQLDAIDLIEDLRHGQFLRTQETERTVEAAEKLATATAAAGLVIDSKMLAAGTKSLEDLTREVQFLNDEFTNISELGQDGLGLAEDLDETRVIVKNLQGTLEGASAKVRGLINEKRRLAEAVSLINEEFNKQDAATDFLDELVMNTGLLNEKFQAMRAGGSLIDITALQQAEKIFADLSKEDQLGTSPEQIQQQIIAQEGLNSAIAALPVDKVAELVQQQQALLDAQDSAQTAEQFDAFGEAADALGTTIRDVALQAAGLSPDLLLQLIPDEQQIEEKIAPFKELLRTGIISPEEFELISKGIEDQFKSSFDTMEQFAIQAARNIQTALADFLYDPFSDGLDGMLVSFGETLRKMTSQILANAILSQFLDSLGGVGGGGIVGAVAGAIGGAADGGRIQGGKPVVVGERGPEIFTPGQSGNVTSNEALNAPQAAPQVTVGGPTIVNTIDDGMIVAAFNRGGGNDVILNNMTEQRSAFRSALGIS